MSRKAAKFAKVLKKIKKVCSSGFYAEKPFAPPVESLQVERFAPWREKYVLFNPNPSG
jgi:hypothetical protein